MNSVIATENPQVATKLRKALAARGHECPITHVVPLEGAERALQAFPHKTDLLFVVLPTDFARAVRIVQKLRAVTQARMVAVGAVNDARKILEILRAGPDDYIDEEADANEQIATPLERLTAQTSTAGGGSLAVVASASGGCGSSLLASNLAVLIAQRFEQCGLMDLSSRFGDLSALLNLSPRHTLAELCRHEEQLDQEMLQQSLTAHDSGVQLIAAAMTEDEQEAITASGVERIVQLGRRMFPWMLLDLGTWLTGRSGLLRMCDKILVPFRLDFTSMCNTRRLLDDWERKEIDLGRVTLIGMRCDRGGELPRSKVATILGKGAACWMPDDPLTANLAINCGVPAVIENPKSAIAVAVRQVANEVCGAGTAAVPEMEPAEAEERRPLWSKFRLLPRMAGVLFC